MSRRQRKAQRQSKFGRYELGDRTPAYRLINRSPYDWAFPIPTKREIQKVREVTLISPDGSRRIEKEVHSEEAADVHQEVFIRGCRQAPGMDMDFYETVVDKTTYEALRTLPMFKNAIEGESAYISVKRVEK